MAGEENSVAGRLVRIVTRCATLDEFTLSFRNLCTEQTMFIPMANPLGPEKQVRYAIALADESNGKHGRVVLRGTGNISESYPNANNPRNRTGMVLEFGRLDSVGRILKRELIAGARAAAAIKTAIGDSDVSFDVSTMVETSTLEELKAASDAERMGKKDLHSGLQNVANLPDLASIRRLTLCEVMLLEESEEDAFSRTGVGSNVGSSVGAEEGRRETTQVAEGSRDTEGDEEKTKAPMARRSGLDTLGAGDATREMLPSGTATTGKSDEEMGDQEPTKVSNHPGLPGVEEFIGEEDDLGEPTRVSDGSPVVGLSRQFAAPVHAIPTIPRIPKPHRAVAASREPVGRRSAGAEEVTKVPPGRKNRPPAGAATPLPLVAAPQQPVPKQTTSEQRAMPLAPTPDPSPAARAPSSPLATGQMPIPAPPPSSPGQPTGIPSPVPPLEPQVTGTPAHGSEVRRATGQAGAGVLGGPMVSSRSRPGIPEPGQSASIHTFASLPMVEPGSISGVAKESRKAKAGSGTVTRRQAGIFGILCLLVGLGLGLLLGPGRKSQASEAVVTNAASPKTSVERTPPVEKSIQAPIVVPPAPLDAGAEVGAESDPDAAPAQVPATKENSCELVLEVQPADASVFVGGELLAAGTIDAQVPCGSTTVTIEHDNFAHYNAKLEFKAGEPTTIKHEMKRAQVMLRIVSVPRKAWVTINDKGVGKTPSRVKVPAHVPVKVRVGRAGFRPTVREVTPTEDMVVEVTLRRARRKKPAKAAKPAKTPWQL